MALLEISNNAFEKLARENKALADVVERIYRLETAHFTSNIFNQTNGPAIVAFSDNYPYGWTSLKVFWDVNEKYRPSGIYFSPNGWKYVKFPNIEAGVFSTAEILKKKASQGKHAGYFFSNNEIAANDYRDKLLQIKPKIVESVNPNIYLI